MDTPKARATAALVPKCSITASVFMPLVKHASDLSASHQAGMLNMIGRYRIEVETFGDRLQKALDQINRERLDAGRDQVKKAHLAKACGVAPAAVTQWISGQTKGMKPENLFAAADFLGIEARWLATGEGPMRVDRRNLVDLSHLDPKQRAAFQALVCPNGDKGTGGNHRH